MSTEVAPVVNTAHLQGKYLTVVLDREAYGIVNGGGMNDGNLAGQFQRLSTEPGDQLAYLITKGSTLTECINGAIKQLTDDGTLAKLATTWLAQGTDGIPIVPRG